MFCSQCGKQCPDGAKFCIYCGASMPEAPVQPKSTESKPVGVTTGSAYSYVPPKSIARDVVSKPAPVTPKPQPEPRPQPQKMPELFCANCGSKMERSDAFCPSCGRRAGTLDPGKTYNAPRPQNQEKPKKNKKRIIAWVLIGLQLFALPMGITNGDLAEMLSFSSPSSVPQLLGYFSLSIIGVSMLISDKKKNKE